MEYSSIEDIVIEDAAYPREAYRLVYDALIYTQKNLKNQKSHVTGQELTIGFREYVVREFGEMSLFVLRKLNIHETIDIGRIVYKMIECGFMTKQDDDKLQHFSDRYNFKDVF